MLAHPSYSAAKWSYHLRQIHPHHSFTSQVLAITKHPLLECPYVAGVSDQLSSLLPQPVGKTVKLGDINLHPCHGNLRFNVPTDIRVYRNWPNQSFQWLTNIQYVCQSASVGDFLCASFWLLLGKLLFYVEIRNLFADERAKWYVSWKIKPAPSGPSGRW